MVAVWSKMHFLVARRNGCCSLNVDRAFVEYRQKSVTVGFYLGLLVWLVDEQIDYLYMHSMCALEIDFFRMIII